MSKFKVISLLSREIASVNQEIDLRIIKGQSYARLARRHKSLVSEIKRLAGGTWLARSYRFLSFF